MTEIPVALIVILALGTVAAIVTALLLVRARGEARRLRARVDSVEQDLRSASRYNATLTSRLQAAESEVQHLSSARIPDLTVAMSHTDVPVRGPLHSETVGSGLDQALTTVLDQFRDAVDKERLRVDAAAQAALRGAATTIQALLYQLQTLLQRMQERYDDPAVAEDLLAADFLNEQALRRIQSTAVVCGAWPGLTRQNSHLADIVVGASSRLNGYERIQVTNQLRDPVGVVARAVEPVAVALTELLANALHYSHPDLPVAVTLQQGNRGASVIIDDAGVGMHGDELRRAERLMGGQEAVLITELGDPPRSGFAAVGRLVRQYGFSTHVETSPYGGVRAIVHIPGDPLLTLLDEEEHPVSAMAPLPPTSASSVPATPEGASLPVRGRSTRAPEAAPAPAAPEVPAGAPEPEPASAEAELPRRRRRRALPEESGAPQSSGAHARAGGEGEGAHEAYGHSSHSAQSGYSSRRSEPAPQPDARESAARWAAFQQGTASGRAAVQESESAASASASHGGAPLPEQIPEPTSVPAPRAPYDGPRTESDADPRESEGNSPA
ncbi:ATP-binding protein [Streptomyces daliensis]